MNKIEILILISMILLVKGITFSHIQFANYPYLKEVDQTIKDSFFHSGSIANVVSTPTQYGIKYEITYESGLRVIGFFDNNNKKFNVVEYQYTKSHGKNVLKPNLINNRVVNNISSVPKIDNKNAGEFQSIPPAIAHNQNFKNAIIGILQKNNVLSQPITKMQWSKEDNKKVKITFVNNKNKSQQIYGQIPTIQNFSKSNTISNNNYLSTLVPNWKDIAPVSQYLPQSSLLQKTIPLPVSPPLQNRNLRIPIIEKSETRATKILNIGNQQIKYEMIQNKKIIGSEYENVQSDILGGKQFKQMLKLVIVDCNITNANITSIKWLKTNNNMLFVNLAPRNSIFYYILITVKDVRYFLTPTDKNIKQNKVIQNESKFQMGSIQLNDLPFTQKDPNYIWFMNSEKHFSTDPLFLPLTQLLNKQIKIGNKYKIVLVNRVKFGIRVLLITETKRIIQVVVQILYNRIVKNYNLRVINNEQLLSLQNLNEDPFGSFYISDLEDPYVLKLLNKVFAKSTALENIQKVSSIFRKIDIDGLYFRIVFRTKQNKQFLTLIHYEPEQQLTAVLEYMEMDSIYDFTQQTIFYPPYNHQINQVNQFIIEKFKDTFSTSSLSQVNNYSTKILKYYRINLNAPSGRYEVIVSVSIQNKNKEIRIIRWKHLDDGYQIFVQSQQVLIKKSILQNYLKVMFSGKQIFQAKMVERKKVGEKQYIKVVYNNPVALIGYMVVEGSKLMTGIQPIKTLPTNKFYSDKRFKGFKEYRLSLFRKVREYENILFEAKKIYSNILRNQTILGIFIKQIYHVLSIKVLYQVQNLIYCGTYEFQPFTNRTRIIFIEQTQDITLKGTYQNNCSQIKNQICTKCQLNYIQTEGRCYTSIQGCITQIANQCFICIEAYTRTSDGLCSRRQNASTFLIPNKITQQKEQKKDSEYCAIYKEGKCEKCVQRFYLMKGVCLKVSNLCDKFNENGHCTSCFKGYHLENQSCIADDLLCASIDISGLCKSCLSGNTLLNGICYVNQNNLCSQWGRVKCVKCVPGSYLTKDGACERQDIKCQIFKKQSGQCTQCLRSYNLKDGKCFKKI